MDYQALSELLFPNVTETPEQVEARFPARNLPEGAVVTRMAPSPTGFVHLGNLVQGMISERMAHQSGGVLFLRVEDTDAKREVPGAVQVLITGFVHLGNLVQGMISERMAHQSGGVLFLRVEDTDAKREVPGAVQVLIESLKFYNIHFDEGVGLDGDIGIYGPYHQRQRANIYHVFAKLLVSQGKAYPCFCTEEELSVIREQQEANKETTGYYGKYAIWRDRSLEEIRTQLDAGNPWVLRFRSEGSIEHQFKFDDLVKGKLTILEEIRTQLDAGNPWVLRFRSEGSIEHQFKFDDLVKGKLTITENDVDHVLLKSDGIPTYHFDDLVKGKLTITENDVDHVLLKSDGIPTYHFAHAVDDHLMRTTHVVRGDEWLPSLPFHIQLFQALGFKLPKYVHIGPLAHAVDDHLMRTTHVVRGDEWLPSLPFHIQLFQALGFKLPKYVHIGPLMKMDGTSKRKLSKRKDPELALTYYKAEGFPTQAVREYLMTVLNSNFEDWRRANPDAPIESFKFSPKKLNPAGSLFDYAKLVDVSKNVISRMDAASVYEQLLAWAKEFDEPFAQKLEADPAYAQRPASTSSCWPGPRSLTNPSLRSWKLIRHMPSGFSPLAGAARSPARTWPPGRMPSPTWDSSTTNTWSSRFSTPPLTRPSLPMC